MLAKQAASTSRTGNRANPKTQGVVILGIVIVAIVFGILLVNVIRDGASIRYFGGSPPLSKGEPGGTRGAWCC